MMGAAIRTFEYALITGGKAVLFRHGAQLKFTMPDLMCLRHIHWQVLLYTSQGLLVFTLTIPFAVRCMVCPVLNNKRRLMFLEVDSLHRTTGMYGGGGTRW